MSVACYKPKFVIVCLFTLLTIHTGPSTSNSRQTTNYFLHNIQNSLTNHNSCCPMALPGVLGCGRGALGWACQSKLCSITSPLLSLGSTLSLFPFHAPYVYLYLYFNMKVCVLCSLYSLYVYLYPDHRQLLSAAGRFAHRTLCYFCFEMHSYFFMKLSLFMWFFAVAARALWRNFVLFVQIHV